VTHDIKSWPGTWEAAASCARKHEIRTADRPFKAGDDVILREFVPEVTEHGVVRDENGKICGTFTGRQILRKITYVTAPGSFGLPADICVFSMEPYPEKKDTRI
jgi:hypothetical protein